jgi:hypothetical protein
VIVPVDVEGHAVPSHGRWVIFMRPCIFHQ